LVLVLRHYGGTLAPPPPPTGTTRRQTSEHCSRNIQHQWDTQIWQLTKFDKKIWVSTAVLFRVHVVRDLVLCCLVTNHSKGRHAIVFSGVSWISQPLKRKAIRSSETSRETNTVTQCHIPTISRIVLFRPRRVTNPTKFKSLSANQMSLLRISLCLSRSFRASLPSHVTAIWLRIWTSCLLQPEVPCVPTICICRLSDSKRSPFRQHTSVTIHDTRSRTH
jgi:hypothetical protein